MKKINNTFYKASLKYINITFYRLIKILKIFDFYKTSTALCHAYETFEQELLIRQRK